MYGREKGEDGMEVKSVSIRIPLEVLDWLRERAARETIKRRRVVSLNAYVVELMQREMEADQEKGGI